MKNFCFFIFIALCALTLGVTSCTLDKEPEIPTGASNEKAPPSFQQTLPPSRTTASAPRRG